MLLCMPLTNKVSSSSSSSSCDISSERDWSERHICPSRHERCFHQTAQVGTLVSSGKKKSSNYSRHCSLEVFKYQITQIYNSKFN